MSDAAKGSPIPDEIERQASIWLLRCDRGFTAADQDHFLQWLAENRLHGECFTAQQRELVDRADARLIVAGENADRFNAGT